MKSFSLAVLVGLVLNVSAFATPQHFKEFKTHYPNYKSASCVICHEPNTGNKHLNGYGLDFQKYHYEFAAIEQLDSDGDTFTNAEEIAQSKNPGDKEIHPTRD